MTVNVTDGADPPLDGWCTFRLEVEDINDNRPQFDRTEYTADITSDTQQNQVIVAVRAYDSDIGMNGEIEYSLLDNAGIFGVYPANGFIYLSESLLGVSVVLKIYLNLCKRARLAYLGLTRKLDWLSSFQAKDVVFFFA